MKNYLARILIPALPFVLLGCATASTINVSNDSYVTLQTNDSLLIYISDQSICEHNFGNPSAIQMLIGSMPLGGSVSPIPGTSGVYFPGILFSGSIQSKNGSTSLPLDDPNADRLHLPAGDLVLIPGWRSGGSYNGPADLLSAGINLTRAESAALFSGDAVIDLENLGAPITFGYKGVTLSNDFSASLSSADGRESAGAKVVKIDYVHDSGCEHNHVPEPGTIGLSIIGLTVLATRWARAR